MEMTITDYCTRYYPNTEYQRIYINRLIKKDKKELLANTYGILYWRKVGPIYVLTVKADFNPNDVNKTITK